MLVQQIPSLTWKWGSNFFSLLILVGYMLPLENLADATLASWSISRKSRWRSKWQLVIGFGQNKATGCIQYVLYMQISIGMA